jgi:phytanoyl-CoA hydroxylase
VFLSVWPETYCYTLSEAYRSGLYPVALAFGAIAERIADPALRGNLDQLMRDGYTVIENAVPHWAIDAYLREYEAAVATPGAVEIDVPAVGRRPFDREQARRAGTKVLDTGMILPSGTLLCFAPRVSRVLEAVFSDKVLAFQTLHFEVGSTQGIHQDTAYVVVQQEPMHLLAVWLALEDVQPGTGELIYYIGGHRIPDFCYSGQFKHWNPDRDGHEQHEAHSWHMHQQARDKGLQLGRFLPRKGDVLFWHADLPHGGSEITQPNTSRRSLVTHYCPRSRDPHYFQFIPEDWRVKVGTVDDNVFASFYYPPERITRARQILASASDAAGAGFA